MRSLPSSLLYLVLNKSPSNRGVSAFGRRASAKFNDLLGGRSGGKRDTAAQAEASERSWKLAGNRVIRAKRVVKSVEARL